MTEQTITTYDDLVDIVIIQLSNRHYMKTGS